MVLVITELFKHIDGKLKCSFRRKQNTCFSRVRVVTELVVSGTQLWILQTNTKVGFAKLVELSPLKVGAS